MNDLIIYDNNELMHYGVLGMKWGRRRYQNKDGTLTEAGRKRVSKEYKKVAKKAQATLSENAAKMQADAYNKAADKMNNGGIDKFNEQQRKKYGEDYAKRDGYISDYSLMFDKEFTKNFNKSLNDFYNNNKHVNKARDMVKKYGMTKWDDLAKNNEAAIADVRRVVEQYTDD